MAAWILCGVLFIIFSLVMARQLKLQKLAVEEIEARHANSLLEARTDAEKRVTRVERNAGLDVQRAQYGLVRDLLPSLDALDEAAKVSTDSGVGLVLRSVEGVLAKHQIHRIVPQPSDTFDPERHEAIEAIDLSEIPAGCIVRTLRSGWECRGEVLRAALVGVSVCKPTPPETDVLAPTDPLMEADPLPESSSDAPVFQDSNAVAEET